MNARLPDYNKSLWVQQHPENQSLALAKHKTGSVKASNRRFRECDEVLDILKLAIQLKDFAKAHPEIFLKSRIRSWTKQCFFKKQESRIMTPGEISISLKAVADMVIMLKSNGIIEANLYEPVQSGEARREKLLSQS